VFAWSYLSYNTCEAEAYLHGLGTVCARTGIIDTSIAAARATAHVGSPGDLMNALVGPTPLAEDLQGATLTAMPCRSQST
jgi:hypothetical protein